jgi:hypothetical protein
MDDERVPDLLSGSGLMDVALERNQIAEPSDIVDMLSQLEDTEVARLSAEESFLRNSYSEVSTT